MKDEHRKERDLLLPCLMNMMQSFPKRDGRVYEADIQIDENGYILRVVSLKEKHLTAFVEIVYDQVFTTRDDLGKAINELRENGLPS